MILKKFKQNNKQQQQHTSTSHTQLLKKLLLLLLLELYTKCKMDIIDLQTYINVVRRNSR